MELMDNDPTQQLIPTTSEIAKRSIINSNATRYSGNALNDMIRMSDAGACQRKLYLKLIGEPSDDYSNSSRLNMEYGHFVHDFLQSQLMSTNESGVRYHSPETTCFLVTPKKRTIVGHCDLLKNDDTVCEFKSTSLKGFKYISRNRKLSKMYEMQVNLYAAALGRPKWEIIYFCRPDSGEEYFCEFNGNTDHSLVKHELDRYDMIYDAVVDGNQIDIPGTFEDRPQVRTMFPCSWASGACDYFKTCYPNNGVENE